MRRLLFLTTAGVCVAGALAGPDVLPIDGVRYVNYDAATGEITPVIAETRSVAHPIWSAGYEYVGYFWGQSCDDGEAGSDWGDVAGPAVVGGFEFSSFTNSLLYDGHVWAVVLFYTEDNGDASAGKVYTAGIRIDNIPGSDFPTVYRPHDLRVHLTDTPFVLDGSDLDGDGLGDFGYFVFCGGRTPGALHGPGIWDRALVDADNLPPEAPGVEDRVDAYADPIWNLSSDNIDPDNINAAYVGSGTFANAYGQVHMVLFAPACPNRGESGRFCTADIDGSFDCLVGLADLSQLLAHYGMTSGATLALGDVDPYDEWMLGDGDVDLGDLAELLSQYGDDCNWP